MTNDAQTVEADTALGKFKISSPNLTALASVVSIILLSLLTYMIWAHADDAKRAGTAVAQELKEANKEVAQTLKESNRDIAKVLAELAQAMRETNCLAQFHTADEKAKNADLCKRISR